MAAPDHGIVLATLIVAAISTMLALVATIIAFMTARYAKAAIGPLDRTVTGLVEVAKSQKLLREIETCGKVYDTLLSIPGIERRAAAEAGYDPAEIPKYQDAMFLVARRQLSGAIHQLPAGLLPEAENVVEFPRFNGSKPYVAAASQEVARKLDELLAELQALSQLTTAGPEHHTYHGRPVSWASVVIIVIGFIVGGAGLVFGPTWWLFWTGAGLAALGGIIALATGIFNDWY